MNGEVVDDVAVLVWAGDVATRAVTYVSRHAERLLGHPVDRWLTEPDIWTTITHPGDCGDTVSARWDLAAERGDYELHYRAVTASGEIVWVHEKIRVSDGGVRGVLIDVTEYREREERERFLRLLDHELQTVADADRCMAVATRLLGEHLRVDRCAYARAEADEDHFVMSGDYATGLPPLPGRFAMRAFGAGAVAAMRLGEPWVVTDSAHDPRIEPEDLKAYQITGIRAVICLPLLRAGRFVAAMAVHQATPRRWTPAEVDLVTVVVNRCWETVQRVHADRALRDSEARHRSLVERATDGIWVLDTGLRFVDVNPAACALLGYDRDELVGTDVADLVVSPDLTSVRERLVAGELSEVWDLRRADGSVVALELSIQLTPAGVQAIGRDVTERQRAEAERELLLQREHEIAEALQRSLLPRELPALDRLATSARYLPAASHAQIGGDWYEVLPVGATTVALTVGDVVGKGPTAAAVMGQLRSALAGYLVDGHSPAAALTRLEAFASRVNGAVGSSCACLTLDWETGGLSWSAAGHPPPLVVDADGGEFLSGGTGAVLGTPGHAAYRDDHVTLAPGASVVLYTDGLVERRDAVLDEGLARLLAVVAKAHDQAPEALRDTITGALLDAGQDDDVAVVVARYLPPPLRTRAPAVASEVSGMRRRIAAWAAVAAFPETLVYDLQLAVSEATANVVDHAYPDGPGEFDCLLASTPAGVRVTVRDEGRWRPESADKGYRGRGLQMIKAMSDEFRLDHDERGTVVEFHVPAEPRPATPLSERAEPLAPVQLVRLTGDVDGATAEEVRADLLAGIARGAGSFEVDLTEVAYLSSAGIAVLIEATEAAAAAGRTMSVTARAGTPPARILELSGLSAVSVGGAA
jgi:anti-anti-sigma factor